MKTRSYLFVYDETVFSNEVHISYLIYCPSNYVFYYHHFYSIHIVWYLFHKRYRHSQSKVPDCICFGLISSKNNNIKGKIKIICVACPNWYLSNDILCQSFKHSTAISIVFNIKTSCIIKHNFMTLFFHIYIHYVKW